MCGLEDLILSGKERPQTALLEPSLNPIGMGTPKLSGPSRTVDISEILGIR